MTERDTPAEADQPAETPPPAAQTAEPPTMPQVSRDESGEGWGDRQSGYDDDWYQRERPPHHG